MSSKPTLRDIAEATGVSTASVSMILNGKSLERFSSQRVASVLAAAERIGALDAAAVRATKRQLRREAASFPQRFEEEIQAINALIVARRAGASQ